MTQVISYSLLACLLASVTFCDVRPAKAETKVLFMNLAGKTITMQTAVEMSAHGETVYRCQAVQAVVSKTGTSITFKVVK